MSDATAVAHPNIALAKYWGKARGLDNAPAVPSLSVTLSGMTTTTRVVFDDELVADTFSLNDAPADGAPLARVVALLGRVRGASGETRYARVDSRNDFPTAAGLASSASGFAALALAASSAAGLTTDPSAVSDLARRASASSARSLFGGFVELDAGGARDAPLPARQVAAPDYLDLHVLVAVTTEATKDVASTKGMGHTASTSPFYAAWVAHAPSVFLRVKEALLARDVPALGEASEESALAMHASAIAARPGLIYWTGATVEALSTVRALRARGVGAWATIDAGPHVKVLCHGNDVGVVRSALATSPGVLRVLETRPGAGARLISGAATGAMK